jgi:hypothetical protein
MAYVKSQLNVDRASWAEAACEAFANQTGQRWHVEPEDVMGDMLADLMHLCMQKGLDFAKLLERGREHFKAEFEGED